jgi:hypothetical protein
LALVALNAKCSANQCNLKVHQKIIGLGHFTCWQECPFGGGGNDMSSPNPDAENNTASATGCAESIATAMFTERVQGVRKQRLKSRLTNRWSKHHGIPDR